MSTKVILNANGVRALLDQDPEFFGELAKNAADQVAQSFARKVLADRINTGLDELLTRQINGWSARENPHRVTDTMRQALAKVAKETIEVQVNSIPKDAIQKTIEASIANAIAEIRPLLEKRVDECIDRIVKARISQAFRNLA